MEYSAVESGRFGIEAYRHSVDDLDVRELQRLIVDNRPDLVIMRMPSANQYQLNGLDRIGIPYLVADTLVHYTSDLSRESDPVRNAGLRLQPVDAASLPVLGDLVREIFPGYTNHYNSNRLLPLEDVLEGYVEWAETYATGEDTEAFLVIQDDEVLGFATCRFDADSQASEGVLYGVRPSAAGRGVYTDIIRLTRDESRRRGFSQMTVSTQSQNLAVQKAWIRSGFTVLKSEVTVHINALLSATTVPEREVSFSVSAETSADYAELTGDANPLHSDDQFAAERGFDGAFAHGLVANGILSKEFGTVYPGAGTVFIGYRYAFSKPIYFDSNYRLRIRFPVSRSSGYHLAVAEIDDGKETCLIAYCDLMLATPRRA